MRVNIQEYQQCCYLIFCFCNKIIHKISEIRTHIKCQNYCLHIASKLTRKLLFSLCYKSATHIIKDVLNIAYE